MDNKEYEYDYEVEKHMDECEECSRINNKRRRMLGYFTTVGQVLALALSFAKWHSLGWAIIHGILGWVYLVYYFFEHILKL